MTTSKAVVVTGKPAQLKVARIVVHRDGSITVHATVSAPGHMEVLVTAWNDNVALYTSALAPTRHRFVVARTRTNVTTAGKVTLQLRPDANGRRLINHPRYPVTLQLWVSYQPPYAQVKAGFYGLHL